MIEHMFDRVNRQGQSAGQSPAMRHDDGVASEVSKLRPLTARSAILSLLLGIHPPSATGSELVGFGRQVGINESAVRAALTRMVAAGDLHRDDGTYSLSDRLLQRQRRQDQSHQVPDGPWNGEWRVAVVVASGKDASTRLHLRRTMASAHFGELREGVWLRPDNLDWQPPAEIADDLALMLARPEYDAAALADRLFEPDRWARVGHELLEHTASARTPRDRLTAVAAVVRHLTHDPLLPDELLPRDWPGRELRKSYDDFRAELMDGIRA
jgi:phenylacetic acid degradation operon negative regulatory protein